MKWKKPLFFAVVAGLLVGFVSSMLSPYLGFAGTYASAVADFALIMVAYYFMEQMSWQNAAIIGAIGTIILMFATPILTPYLGFAGIYAAVLATIISLFVADWVLVEMHMPNNPIKN